MLCLLRADSGENMGKTPPNAVCAPQKNAMSNAKLEATTSSELHVGDFTELCELELLHQVLPYSPHTRSLAKYVHWN